MGVIRTLITDRLYSLIAMHCYVDLIKQFEVYLVTLWLRGTHSDVAQWVPKLQSINGGLA